MTSIAWGYMVKERGSVGRYSPLTTDGDVLLNMQIVGAPFRDSEVVGEYWFEGTNLHMKLYDEFKTLEDVWTNKKPAAALPAMKRELI
jgi:hypothetical protein